MSHYAAVALEMQDELRRWWMEDSLAPSLAQQLLETMYEEDVKHTLEDGRMLCALMGVSLEQAATFWVSDDMSHLAWHAATTMPDQGFAPSDLPAPRGFLLFEKPVLIPDSEGVECPVRAIEWAPVVLEQDVPVGHQRIGRLGDSVSAFMGYDSEVNPIGVQLSMYADSYVESNWLDRFKATSSHRPPRLFVCALYPIYFGEHLCVPRQGAAPVEAVIATGKFPKAVWTMMQQRLSRTQLEPAERHARRRMERARSPLALKTVRVVTLRQFQSRNPHALPKTVKWSHRWIVSGFWRNQWFPAHKLHRHIWIPAFVKGPGDKPLLHKRTVAQWVR